ncbi:MAG: hypothetical protein R2783_08460 [Gelidibacter sp.]
MNKIELIWNKICDIFDIMRIKNGHITKNGVDTGVRATSGGKLYVEKKVFFKREDVRNVLKKVMGSEELKAHIATNKK